MELNGTLILQIIHIGIAYLIVRILVMRPALRFIIRRADRLSAQHEQAHEIIQQTRQEAEAAHKTFEKKRKILLEHVPQFVDDRERVRAAAPELVSHIPVEQPTATIKTLEDMLVHRILS